MILNLMQRMCGIATLTDEYVKAVAAKGIKTKILDTRKTIPGAAYAGQVCRRLRRRK